MFDCVGFFQDLLITRPLGQFRILTIILVELVLLMDTKIFFFFFWWVQSICGEHILRFERYHTTFFSPKRSYLKAYTIIVMLGVRTEEGGL